ncbi:DNA-directed RNA polymerase sigma-70 factor [Paraoerskovia sediminicola]|uniref:DNA-directed RNA polymerase sigma-70 factor n=1 Tax=Paraoerskovia sediminicola TaxID=1138587 RepID=A0ABM8FZG5_9CELL|nr:sigma-70 family RNA polymerase sigma factor [Paraoerskovia sediminicola]BDZ41217.1 DNA-directed RNA polymerase sigma-70 factor [Paraoerskovia sediminicola]
MTEHTHDAIEAPGHGSTLGDRAAYAVVRYRSGDPTALDAFVREATPLLWHTARSQGTPRELADDVVQSTWVALVRHVDTIEEPMATLKWLLITTKRTAWDVVRRHRTAERASAPLPDDDPTGPPRELVDDTSGPADLVLRDERDRALWDALATLPERCRTLLRLVSMADRPDYRAISEAVGMPVGSIGSTRGRCLAKLRTALRGTAAGQEGQS